MSTDNLELVVAMDQDGGIGKDGTIPWRVKADLKHFKDLTSREGKAVLMGRRTWDSLPEAYKPLPNRTNAVITRSDDLLDGEGVAFFPSPDEAIESLTANHDQVFIIGGAEIYEQTLHLCRKLYITRIEGDFDCDVFFPYDVSEAGYRLIETLEEGFAQPWSGTLSGYHYKIELWESVG